MLAAQGSRSSQLGRGALRNGHGGDLEGPFLCLLPATVSGAQQEELFFFFSNFLVQVWSCPSHEPLMLTGCAPRSYWGQGCVWRWGWLRSAETPLCQDSQAGRPSLGRS